MTFFKRINTKIRPFINKDIFRHSHHYQDNQYSDIQHHYSKGFYLSQQIIINLLGDFEYVNTASWEIYKFAQYKQLPSANIVYHDKMLKDILYNKYSQFVVNRCYNMSCDNIILLNQKILNTNLNWKPYNLYVIPNAKNRFTTCNFIQNCNRTNFIVYPLAASEETKRRDINILID
jgi:hypothetical protein